jgi:hypothetical protein
VPKRVSAPEKGYRAGIEDPLPETREVAGAVAVTFTAGSGEDPFATF